MASIECFLRRRDGVAQLVASAESEHAARSGGLDHQLVAAGSQLLPHVLGGLDCVRVVRERGHLDLGAGLVPGGDVDAAGLQLQPQADGVGCLVRGHSE